jgi:hypothetical protein
MKGPSPQLKPIFQEFHQLKMNSLGVECDSGYEANSIVIPCANDLQNDGTFPETEQKREVSAYSCTNVALGGI